MEGNSSAYYQLLELLLVAMQLAYPTIYQLLQSNEDFTSWKKNILVNIKEKSIEENVREGFDITTRTWSQNDAQIHTLLKRGYKLLKTLANDRGAGVDTLYFGKVAGCISIKG